MLAVLLLAAVIWWGFGLLRLSGVALSPEARLGAAPVLGAATGFWVVYLLAASAGGLSTAVLLSSCATFALVGALSRLRPKLPGRPANWFVALVATVGLALLAMNLFGVLAPRGDAVVAVEHVWADLPFHVSIVNAFAYHANIPPTYPLALGQPLGYPFLIDFASGSLVVGGLSLRASIIALNVLVQVGFFACVGALTLRLTRSALASVLAVGVLFGLGNLGILAVWHDVHAAHGVGAWLRDLPWSYTGDALGDKGRDRIGMGVYLGNPTFMFFLPRRSAAFGLATGAALLLLLDDLAERPALAAAVLAGAVAGVLPRVHAHTAIAMVVFAGAWFLTLPRRHSRQPFRVWREAFPSWFLVAGVAAVVALPQLGAITRQSSGFMSFWPGWTGEAHDAFAQGNLGRAIVVLAGFWLVNGGLLVPLAIAALWFADRRMLIWYLPFGLLWVLGNVVRTQPWEWDNNNFFVYWQFGTCVLVAPVLAGLIRRRAIAIRAGGIALVAVLVAGGLLSFTYVAEHRQHLWTREEVALARWVRTHTPSDAVILTSNGHTEPLLALSGRQMFMGFPGWFVAHGLDWARYQSELERMYRGDIALMRRRGIDYVVVGPWERGFVQEHGFGLPGALEDPTVFRVVHRASPGGVDWIIYRLLPPG